MEQQEKISFAIQIESIQLLAFKSNRSTADIDPAKVNFNIAFICKGEPKENRATIDLKIKIFNNVKNEVELGSIETRGSYLITIKSSTDVKKYPKQIIGTILGSQLSTTRGMLIILSPGTPFEKAILPMINVFDKFFKEKQAESPASQKSK